MSQTGPAAALAALLSGAEAPASQPVAGIATENPGAAGFEVGGRVFYREEALKDDSDWTYEHRLRSARMSVDYWRGEWLGVQVEVEVSGKPRATDAYVRLEEGRLSLRAGQFKTPSSVIELESAWVLPTTERGLLHEILVERLAIGGRHPGAEVRWKPKVWLAPELRAGVFQATDEEADPLEAARADDTTIGVRASIRPAHRLRVGVFGELRGHQPLDVQGASRFWSAGLDASLDLAWLAYGLRAWADVSAGSSELDDDPQDDDHAVFVAGRAIVGFRRGGIAEGSTYVEPYAAVSVLDPETGVGRNLAWELLGGINVGRWDWLRLTLEGVLLRVDRNASPFLGPDATRLDDGYGARLQLGVAF